MEIFFRDPNEVPLPPEEVRIRELRADPLPDGQRVRVYLETEPFQKRPSADLVITDETGQEVAAVSIIESMLRKMELTMHLRGGKTSGKFTLHADLFYGKLVEPEPGNKPAQEAANYPLERTVVDQAEAVFEIQAKASGNQTVQDSGT